MMSFCTHDRERANCARQQSRYEKRTLNGFARRCLRCANFADHLFPGGRVPSTAIPLYKRKEDPFFLFFFFSPRRKEDLLLYYARKNDETLPQVLPLRDSAASFAAGRKEKETCSRQKKNKKRNFVRLDLYHKN